MWQEIIHSIQELNWLDIGALITGVVYVIAATREKAWCWPVGIANVMLFFIIDYQALLYGEMGLQVVYFFLSLYGWYNWLHGGRGDKPLDVTKASWLHNAFLIVLVFLATIGLGRLLGTYTNTDVPYWDAWTNAMNIAAVWLQTRKKLDNWIFWIVVDVVYVWLFAYKGFYFSSVLFGFYVILAAYGFISWRRSMLRVQGS